jgi:hypothetical protein
MASMVFGVSALDPAVIVGAAVFMAVVAAFAAYLPRIGRHRCSRAPLLQ